MTTQNEAIRMMRRVDGGSPIEPPVADEIYCAVCNENMAPETDWHTECCRDDCPHFKPSPEANK